MKKGLFLKYIAMLLSVMLVLSIAACGGTPTATEKPGETTDKSANGDDKEEPFEVVTLEVFSLPSNKSGLVEGWWAEILEEDVGVQLEIIPAGDQGEQKLQALMSGGELPDIVVFKTSRQVVEAVRANMLVNLDEHMDKLPNVAANAPVGLQYYRDIASNDTGNAYSIPSHIGPSGVGDEINWGPFLRWDLYKELGMPKVSTLEDYLPLLKQMQELEPENEDGQKVYGITLWQDWDSNLMQQASTVGCMFGVDTEIAGGDLPFLEVDYKTNETKSILAADSFYMRTLRFFYEANQLGLVDPDSLTQRFDTASQKASEGRVLFGFWPWLVGGYNTIERTNADPPKGFRPVLPEDYKAFWWADNPIGNPWSFSISAATKNLDAALRFVDYMYSADGLLKLNCGPQGLVWDIDENGEPYVTDEGWNIIENEVEMPGGGMLYEPAQYLNSAGISSAFIHPEINAEVHYQYWPSSQSRNPTKLMEDWSSVTGYKRTTDMLADKEMRTIVPLASSLVPVMGDDIRTLTGQIGDVVKTNSWQMVFAENEEEFEALYNEMVEKAEGFGIQQILDWSNEAWQTAKDEAKNYTD